MNVKSIVLTTMVTCLMPLVSAQENIEQQDLLLEVFLGAYNGGAQTYAEKTNMPANLLSKEDLEQLQTQLQQAQTQLQQLQVLVTDETGQLDIDKVTALLNLISQSDAQFMGIEGSRLQAPLQLLQSVSEQGEQWQEALLELKAQNQPLIERTLNELSTGSDKQGRESIANVLSIMLGAGMAIEEMTQAQTPIQIPAQTSTQTSSNALSKEVDFLKALAGKDMPALLHTNIHHQFEALISRLKIAYADSNVKEQTASNTQDTILAVKYFLSQANGQLTQSEYEELLLWLDRLGSSYQEVRQQVVKQHVVLTKDTK